METEIKTLIAKIKKDYINFCTCYGEKELSGYHAETVANFDKNIGIKEGNKYTKIVRDGSVWGFIVKEDGPRFSKGDILKAATWSAPATNSARGNIYDDDYSVQWTGPHYLK
tara:strand:- start:111 stop:446 length:336 start_codon:yes stop_codon:yes gene_type:complete